MEEKDMIEQNNISSKNKNKILIIVLIVVLLLGVSCFLYYYFVSKNEKITNNSNNESTINNNSNKTINQESTESEVTKLIEEDGTNFDYSIYPGIEKDETSNYQYTYNIYYNNNGTEFCKYKDVKEDCGKEITIKVNNKKIERLDYYEDIYYLYKDGNVVKIYNNKTNTIYNTSINSDYYEYYLEVDMLTNEIIGIKYIKDEEYDYKYKFYLLNKGKTLNITDSFNDFKILNKKYLYGIKNDVASLVDINNEKIIKSFDNNGEYESFGFSIFYNNKGLFFGEYYKEEDEFVYTKIYSYINNNFIPIVENVDYNYASISSDGLLYVATDGIVNAYDNEGKIIKTSNKYDIKRIIGNYIIAIKDKKIIITTIDNNETIISSGNKEKTESFDYYNSYIVKEKNEEKIYIVIESDDTDSVLEKYCKKNKCKDKYTEKSLIGFAILYRYYYIPKTGKIGKRISDAEFTITKPFIITGVVEKIKSDFYVDEEIEE